MTLPRDCSKQHTSKPICAKFRPMCYSAQVKQHLKELERRFGAHVDLDQVEMVLRARLEDNPGIRIPRAFEANFATPTSSAEERIKALIDKHRALATEGWQMEMFAQKKRLADAQRKLAAKETKAARNDERIATKKIEQYRDRLVDLERTDLRPGDARIFPKHYAPIVIEEAGARKIVLARYLCRGADKPAEFDEKFPGLYNARRDNLERFWRGEFGQTHAVCVIDAFFENVDRDGHNAVLKFAPQPGGDMTVACLYARWVPRGGGPELLSFAAITDDPPAEIAAAGHDRCVINLKPDNVAAWLAPQGRPVDELQRILGDVERPYYEHQVLAA